MRLVVNGVAQEVAADSLAAALIRLDYGEAKVATALNGEFVPARQARRDAPAATATASRSSRRGKAGECELSVVASWGCSGRRFRWLRLAHSSTVMAAPGLDPGAAMTWKG